jgi:hypothetical protein
MNEFSIEEGLRRLEANPAAAAKFDAATKRERPHCKTRREAVVAVLAAVNAIQGEIIANRMRLEAAKNKLATLEAAKATNARLTAELTAANARIATLSAAKAKARMAPTAQAPVPAPAPAPAPARRKWANPAPTSAAPRPQATTAPTSNLSRDQFRSLSPQARMDFIKSGGKLSN